VANQHTNNLVVYQIDTGSGLPIYCGVEMPVLQPACILARQL